MDRAGYAVALAAVRAGAGYGARVLVLAGPGNNGGDGYVAARHLKGRGCDVEVRAFAMPRTEAAIDAARKARAAGVRMTDLGAPEPADVVIDALFGGGVRGGVPADIREWMATPAPVVAVDYPTGLDPNTGKVEDVAFDAVETVTFQTLKTGHVRGAGPDRCGTVTVVDIGIPGGEPCMFVAEESDALRPRRQRVSHKWSAGAVLVAGGSTGMVGAAVFAGVSALNFGAGTVVVASPRADLVTSVAPQLPSFDIEEAETRVGRFDVVIAGPGLAGADGAAVVTVLRKAQRVVLDAGGLTSELLAASQDGDGQVVVTPHAGEFARLTGAGPGAFAARSFALRTGTTVLLKGNPTIITNGDRPVLVDSGGPELATIGTGDVLAGMIGALWARGLTPLDATVSGAYWHGVAGAQLARHGAVTAPELAAYVNTLAW
jgi:ADP-dependent NAD(P)H-hydrate dehydratase / NAD(P)H-hydrate epimerase